MFPCSWDARGSGSPARNEDSAHSRLRERPEGSAVFCSTRPCRRTRAGGGLLRAREQRAQAGRRQADAAPASAVCNLHDASEACLLERSEKRDGFWKRSRCTGGGTAFHGGGCVMRGKKAADEMITDPWAGRRAPQARLLDAPSTLSCSASEDREETRAAPPTFPPALQLRAET